MSTFNGYSLTENWFSFMAENGQKVECKHTAVYLYIVEIFNKRQWVKSIGLPTDFTMSALNIGSYKTYKKILTDLVEFGFLNIEWSRNQHTSNKVELVKNTKPNSKHIPKQSESNDQSTSSINKTYKLLNNKQINKILTYFNSIPISDIDLKIDEIIKEEKKENPNEIFLQSELVEPGAEERKKVAPKKEINEEKPTMPEDFIEIWEEWKEYRKAKQFKSYAGLKWEQMAVDKLLELSNKKPTIAKLILKQTYENSYQGFFPLKQNSNGITNTTNTGFSTSKPSTNNGNSGKRTYRQILAERLTNELKANGEGSNITIDAEICE